MLGTPRCPLVNLEQVAAEREVWGFLDPSDKWSLRGVRLFYPGPDHHDGHRRGLVTSCWTRSMMVFLGPSVAFLGE